MDNGLGFVRSETQNFDYETEYKGRAVTQDYGEGEYLDDEMSVGYRFGKYYVPVGVQELGKGGQARIYECFSEEDDNTYVAKIYSTEFKHINKVRELNQQIMRIAARNVVHIYDAGDTEDGEYYMVVMDKYEKLREDFLNFELHGNEKNYRTLFNRAVKDLNEGLKQLHVRTIYHSDIKPGNVMRSVDENGRERMVLIDFGGSVVVDDEEKRKGKASAISGAFSLGYQAPEQLDGVVSKASERTDAYSMGITLAELVAGVYPKLRDLKSDEASPEQKAYYERNKEGKNVFGVLLPVGLPNHMIRLFQGLLYYDLDEPDNLKYRWGDSKVETWLESSMEGDYKTAASMKYGAERPAQNHRTESAAPSPKNQARKIFVPYASGTEQIGSLEEMAQLFVDKWDETIDTLTNRHNWARSFSVFGQDIVQTLMSAGERMKENPANAQEELKNIILLFGNEKLKEEVTNSLRVGSHIYTSKEDFGRKMYAELDAAAKAIEDKENMKLEDSHLLENSIFWKMICEGKVQNHIRQGGKSWQVEDEVLEMMDSIDHYGKDLFDYQEAIVKLFHIAFRMQNITCFKLDGKLYTSYQEFLNELEELAKSQPEKAKELFDQCMINGRYRIEFFAWLMAVNDIKERPNWITAQV